MEGAIPIIAEKFAKCNWPSDLLLCCQSITNLFKMRALTLVFCVIFIHVSVALQGKKYKRIMIDGGTWNSMQIRSHSDSEARGLVIQVRGYVQVMSSKHMQLIKSDCSEW